MLTKTQRNLSKTINTRQSKEADDINRRIPMSSKKLMNFVEAIVNAAKGKELTIWLDRCGDGCRKEYKTRYYAADKNVLKRDKHNAWKKKYIWLPSDWTDCTIRTPTEGSFHKYDHTKCFKVEGESVESRLTLWEVEADSISEYTEIGWLTAGEKATLENDKQPNLYYEGGYLVDPYSNGAMIDGIIGGDKFYWQGYMQKHIYFILPNLETSENSGVLTPKPKDYTFLQFNSILPYSSAITPRPDVYSVEVLSKRVELQLNSVEQYMIEVKATTSPELVGAQWVDLPGLEKLNKYLNSSFREVVIWVQAERNAKFNADYDIQFATQVSSSSQTSIPLLYNPVCNTHLYASPFCETDCPHYV
eukprot:GHVS01100269.1.p1 GENE.GHVS01100269.1~~GHVS01100269.1.p1  ORF type:complete len:361 (-),score=15.59 GHVS01100269.1:171-1253(-)